MSATYDAISWDWHYDGEGNLVSVQMRAAPLALTWPETDEVLVGVEYGPEDDLRTGTATGGGGENDAIPRIASAVPGNAQATLSVSGVESTDVVRVAYRMRHASWTIASATRTGPGSVTITGLRNDTEYEFAAWCTRSGARSIWTPTVRLAPAADAPANTRYAQLLQQRDGMAEAHLNACKAMGVVITYTTAAGVAINGLYALSEMQNMATGLLGGRLDDEPFLLHIPRQTDFPPAAFHVGDTVTLDGTVYAVQSADGSHQNATLSAIFDVRIDRVHSTGSTL